ncbi:hypothetical protein RSOLAG1IB_11905 [Rhizoctonia solani AG-1 IB]|uniref:Uncharacterized protein n=1 Tax=Thanatephorus cucumeris (strain AG1-IB / isolate 7/3/14) TaxID=1108050 RepID=A0A0B7FHA2_THACB|nr:hypothetical protein RSOLAG1IB_11905 [Rhizoctonia solani AG-1 IB]
MINTWNFKKPRAVCDIGEEVALPLSLCVLAKAAFGQDVSWGSENIPMGHVLTFKDALSTASKTMHYPLMIPNWAWGLRTSWSRAKQAHDELRGEVGVYVVVVGSEAGQRSHDDSMGESEIANLEWCKEFVRCGSGHAIEVI